MNTSLETVKSAELEPHNEARGFLEMIAQASRDPNVSVDKLERLMAMKERFDKIQAEVEFKAAKARLHEKLPTITEHGRIMNKDKVTVRSTYAPYEDLDEIIRPLLAEEGFSLSFDTVFAPNPHAATAPGTMTVRVEMAHRMGHSETRSVALPVDRNEYRTGVQDVKSTFTFGRRVATIMLLNIVTVGEDLDGQNKTEPITLVQVNKIRDLIIHKNANEARFCQFMDVQCVEEITQDRFKMALNALNMKGQR